MWHLVISSLKSWYGTEYNRKKLHTQNENLYLNDDDKKKHNYCNFCCKTWLIIMKCDVCDRIIELKMQSNFARSEPKRENVYCYDFCLFVSLNKHI